MPVTYDAFPSVVSSLYKTAGTPIPQPSRPLTEGVKTSTIIYSADSGHEQRRTRSQPKRTFDLQWNVLTQDQYNTLRDFFMQKLNVTPFTWTHPVDYALINNQKVPVQFLVRFDMDLFSGKYSKHSPIHTIGALYELQVKLVQVWS